MVQLVKHDLEFILAQIKIAEQHATGGDLAALVAGYNGNDGLAQAHLLPYGLRTVDGSYNNLLPGRENWGASDQSFPGIFTPTYLNDADGDRYDFNPLPNVETWYSNNDYANAGTRTGSQPGPGSGTVIDADPRIISNLIVDQTLDNPAAIATALTHAGLSGQPLMTALGEIVAAHKAAKPLAPVGSASPSPEYEAAKAALDTKLEQYGVEMDGNTVFIPNVAPDEGLSSPFNGWMTIFGQFFDHGLDLVAKGGNGTVYVPLSPDDPLYVPGGQNYIPLTRVTVNAGPDGRLGTVDDGPGPKNLTTPWVDQNQTYASTASKQVFMREYVAGPDGKPIATGHLLEGSNGGLATWADIKAQARTVLGIELTDLNVGNIPLIASDPYGNFIPGANGYPQLVVGMGPDGKLGTADDVLREGNPAAPVSAQGVVLTGHAFLDDIAHAAVPVVAGGVLQADTDTALGYANADGTPGPQGQRGPTAYDNELLDRHFVAGDGRANENIALTAVHQVFHAEHNRVVEMTKTLALQSGDLKFLNEWLLVDVTAIPTTEAEKAALVWDGERLFQAGRFTNEMEYQHLVFEEFGRMMQPDIDPFVFEPSADINPSIAAEFAHVVYRFGHSMLRQDIAVIEMGEDGKPVQNDVTLFDGFLNPVMYDSLGDAEAASGAIIRGMSRQVGSEIDEFVTDVLRNQLLGIPLDLATINLARGRDVGTPPLNAAREKFFAATGDTLLKPYTSWADFALNLKNAASIINFVAAYGTHETLINTQASPKTVEQLREAATLLVLGGTGAPADRLDFLNSTGAWAGQESGLNTVDFWMGGLAEKKMAFGGMLGSTFAFVFQMTMENLQDADRFYYLSRTQGLNLLNELENNTFAELVMRNTDLGDESSTALPGNLFSAFEMPTLEMDPSKQLGDDPAQDNPFLPFANLIERRDAAGNLIAATDKTTVASYIRVNSNEHFTIGGTEGNDTIVAGGGDDAVWGRGGDDNIEAGYGVDKVFAGEGDDIITNSGTDIGETDFLHGNEGNDAIHGGSGLALLFGNQGNDFIVTGPDGKEAFAGTGDDFVLGGSGGDALLGNEGNDWLEGGPRFDSLSGENSELFFNSSIIGHDVLLGNGGDTDYDGESGDDIMGQYGEGIQRSNGMAGFDWAVHKDDSQAANSNLGISVFDTQEAVILRDRFDLVEGLSGWKHSDTLTGRAEPVNTTPEATGTAAIPGPNSALDSYSNALLEKNVDLITGLRALVAHITRTQQTGSNGVTETVVMDTADSSDILLGGGGSDMIKGLAGNDVIDGDKWLNVRIRFVKDGVAYTVDEMAGKVWREADYVNGAPTATAVAQFGGKLLTDLVFGRVVNPGSLQIVREIADGNKAGDVDTAVYTDVIANYSFGTNSDGSIFVEHTGFVQPQNDDDLPEDEAAPNARSDGKDTVRNVEKLQFSTSALNVIEGTDAGETLNGTAQADLLVGKGGNDVLNGGAGDDILIGSASGPATSGTYADNFSTASPAWTETGDLTTGNVLTGGQIRISNGALQFRDDDNDGVAGGGASIQRVFNLAGANTATISYSYAENSFDAGETVTVLFSPNGAAPFQTVQTIDGNSGSGTTSVALTGPFTAGAVLRFVVNGTNNSNPAGNDVVSIDNLQIAYSSAEILNGGAGNDTYVIGLADGQDVISDTSGSDRIQIAANGADLSSLAFERVAAGGNTADDLRITFGTSQIDVTSHYSSTSASPNPGSGAIETIAFTGGASIHGYEVDAGPYNINASRALTLNGTAQNDVLVAAGQTGNIETVLNGDAGDDMLFGAGGADVLNGGADDDLLVGGADDDTLDGGLGADVMVGGTGNDVYVVDDADDVVTEAANGGTDRVETTLAAYTLGANVESLTYTGAGTFAGTGNELANRIVGGAGVDTLSGGGGNDTYVVTAGDIIVEAANGGTDAVETAETYTLGADLENLTLTGNAAVNGTGNEIGNVITGNGAANQLLGGGGNDTMNGGGGNDFVDGGTGNDSIDGGTGDDTIVGGAGDEVINVGSGNDVVRFDANGFGSDVINGFDANPAGGQDRIDLGGLGVTAANFAQRVTLTAGTGANTGDTIVTVRNAENSVAGIIRVDNVTIGTGATQLGQADFILASGAAPVTGTAGNNTLNGTANNDTIAGALGNDTINAQAGDDTIVWNANASGATDGRDRVDGGTEGVAGDTFVINGNAGAETYRIYTRAAFDAVPGNTLTGIAAATEIIVTRNGTNAASIIAELADIEEIRINGFDPAGAGGTAGNDTFQIVGDFSQTSLRLNTITIDGGAGDSTVDISELTSDHRIVFKSGGGHDTIVGTLRPQDVIELPDGASEEDYTAETDENGVTTLSRGSHTVRFKRSGDDNQPGHGDDEEEENTPPAGGDDDDEDDTPPVGSGGDDDDHDDDVSCGSGGSGDNHQPGQNGGGSGNSGSGNGSGSGSGSAIVGTAAADVLLASDPGATILALGGDDNVVGGKGADVIESGAGNDFVSSGAGRDIVFGGAGDDTTLGGADEDMLYGGGGDDKIFGDGGNDLIDAGSGNDTSFGGAGNDMFVASAGDGDDTYHGDDLAGGGGIDTLDMAAITASISVDLGSGMMGRGSAFSVQTGNDTLWGIENVITGSGSDVITASAARNVMDGGAGQNVFRFLSAADADGDTIVGFQAGDRIDLSAVDAGAGTSGNQAFTLQNGSSFSGPAQLVISHETRADGDYTVVSGNTSGADAAEFRISIKGNHDLQQSDFSL